MPELGTEVTPEVDAEAMHRAGLAAAAALPTAADPGTSQVPTPEGADPNAATPAAPAEVDSFSGLDPSTIPPELMPWYKSMQADYTRKMQETAPLREVAETAGLDAGQLGQAAELYAALQDPEQLVSFYNELTTALQANGFTPEESTQIAQAQIAGAQVPDPGQGEYVDPETARVNALEQRLATFEKQNADAQRAQAEERMQMNLVAEMNRMEMVVKEAHPDWDQKDLDAVYELSAFYGGDLITAADRLDAYANGRLTKILNGKVAAASLPGNHPVVPSTGMTRGMDFGDDLDAAHKAAMAAVRAMPAPVDQ